jgi:hypothetical protein
MTKDDYERLAADAAGRFVFGESETSRSYPANASSGYETSPEADGSSVN